MKMPEFAIQIVKFSPDVLREAIHLFDHIGYREDCFEDVYQVACGQEGRFPTKADGLNLAMSAFAATAARETKWLIERENPGDGSIRATLGALRQAWPESATEGRSSVLAVLAEDQQSYPAVVEEAQSVASGWADLMARQLRFIPALQMWRETRIRLLASEMVAAVVSGYRLSVTYRNHIHYHRVLDHWLRQLSIWSASQSSPS